MGQLASNLHKKNSRNNLPHQENKVTHGIKLDHEPNALETALENYSNNAATYGNSQLQMLARPPLKRSFSTIQDLSIIDKLINVSTRKKQKLCHEEFVQYPFTSDDQTIDYYRHSKIMIILRGLPGCGKTTLAKRLLEKFPSGVICSADDYFVVDGKYEFKAENLKHAHKQCKENVVNSVKSQVPIVIVDNTNLRLWQMAYYLRIAKLFNYIQIVVEPRNEWRRDIASLSAKNQHFLGVNQIIHKMSVFQEAIPLYYGWFLNDKDSYLVYEAALKCIQSLLIQAPHLSKRMAKLFDIKDLEGFKKFFHQENPMLHCTAKYIGNTESTEKTSYMKKDKIIKSIGKVSTLHVIGFVVSPRTFSAQIQLDEDQLQLWGANDEESIPEEFWVNLDIPEKKHSEEYNSEENQTDDASESFNEIGETIPDNDLNPADNTNVDISCENDTMSLDSSTGVNTTSTESETSSAAHVGTTNKFIPKIMEGVSSGNATFDVSATESSLLNGSKNHESSNESTIPDLETTVDEWKKPDSPESLLKKCRDDLPKNTISIEDSKAKQTVIYSKYSDLVSLTGKGSRAHVTLGCAEGIKPVTAGLDTLFGVWAHDNYDERRNITETIHCDTTSCQAKYYGHGLFILSLYEKIEFEAVFSPFHSKAQ